VAASVRHSNKTLEFIHGGGICWLAEILLDLVHSKSGRTSPLLSKGP
jgi:hypothetical protein